MNRSVLNIVIVWAVILAWGFLRGWQMSPPGYIAIAAATAITCYSIYSFLKGRK